MAGLVGYASSDEEDEETTLPQTEPSKPKTPAPQPEAKDLISTPAQPPPPAPALRLTSTPTSTSAATQPSSRSATIAATAATTAPIQHPTPLGPSLPTSETPYLPEPDDDEPPSQQPDPDPQSPYSASRSSLRNLTLPTVPDLTIPPSPPGSPPPALNAKFENFLALKQKGVHFNSKLANSTALRNPGLMDKLLDFIELGPEEGEGGLKAQYGTTLSTGCSGGSQFPEWAFRASLRQSQDNVRREKEKEREKGQRSGIEFVGSVGGKSEGGLFEAGGLRGNKRKADGW